MVVQQLSSLADHLPLIFNIHHLVPVPPRHRHGLTVEDKEVVKFLFIVLGPAQP